MDPMTAMAVFSAINGAMGYVGQQHANSMNADQAKNMMDFQAGMSGTAHLREVGDLKNAGLNPILSAGGSGAPMGTGAQAEMGSPLGKLSEGISKGMDTGIALRAQNKAMQTADAGLENTKEDTANKIAQNALITNQAGATAKEIEQKSMSNKILKETLDAQIKKAKADGNYAELNQIMGVVNSGASSASSLINSYQNLTKPKISLPEMKPLTTQNPYGR